MPYPVFVDRRITWFVNRHSRLILIPLGLILIGATALVDYATGPELSFGIFYLLPIAAGAWGGNFSYGIFLSLASALAWHLVDLRENPMAPTVVYLWNGTVRFSFFVITSSLLARLRNSMLQQQRLARTDSLTGAANGRTFYELAQRELERSLRSGTSFSLAYIDLDNFKTVNDLLGHPVGDEVLRGVAQTIQENTRPADLLARIGGDEFALLLPETGHTEAEASLHRLRELLENEMASHGWPVTFSMGVATFIKPPQDVGVMLQHVDALMYAAKRNGKNRIHVDVVQERITKDSKSAIERRSTVRILCNCPMRLRPQRDQETIFALIKNFSTGGVGILVENPIREGSLVAIEPMCNPGAKTLLARVIRTAPHAKGWFHGCELTQPLALEELQTWLA